MVMYKHLLSLLSTIYIISHYPLSPRVSLLLISEPSLSLRRYVSTVIQKRCYFQGNKFAPDVHEGLKYTQPEAWDQF